MNSRNRVVFIWLPAVVCLALMALCFSGVPWLEMIIAPPIAGIGRNSWREFGLLENLQHVYLTTILVMCGRALRNRNQQWEKWLFAIVCAAVGVLLAEELDYGRHWWDLIFGVHADAAEGIRNLHNIGDTTDYIKRAGDGSAILWFVLLPWLYPHPRSPVLRYLLPSRWCASTMLLMLALSELVHRLVDAGVSVAPGMRQNVSEFRELNVYYLYMIYFYDLIYLRTSPPGPTRAASAVAR
ncbi:MAG TPA: hypothetical protein VM616_05315 [Gammaproteobacteria bacterium]|nr:hypothetical protein [Gammaproteobacteria bacterium]